MIKFKNMKIKVENNLDEIVRELEKRGYVNNQFYFHIDNHRDKNEFNSIACYTNGSFYYHKQCVDMIFYCELTTLAELKGMK